MKLANIWAQCIGLSLTTLSFANIAPSHRFQVAGILQSPLLSTMAQLERNGITPSQMLLVFDDDNTLETTDKFGCTESPYRQQGHNCQYLGSVAWSNWQGQLLKRGGPTSPDLVAKTSANIYNIEKYIYGIISMVPTEPKLVSYINSIEKRGVPTIVETARDSNMLDNTEAELSRAHFKFSNLEPNLSLDFTPTLQSCSVGGREVALQHGIMAIAGQNKGQMLGCLFAHIKALYPSYQTPKAILFVDDTDKNDQDVFSYFVNQKIPVYTFTDNHMQVLVNAFADHKMQTVRQWKVLKAAIVKKIPHGLLKYN